MDQIVHRQESASEEYDFQLQFHVGGVQYMYPKASISSTRQQQLDLLPKRYDSGAYNCKAGPMSTSWKIGLQIYDVKEEELAIGSFLTLISCTVDEGVKQIDPCGSTQDCVLASFTMKLMSSVGDVLLTKGSDYVGKYGKAPNCSPSRGYPNLLSLNDLWETKNKYCDDGTLRLRVELKILGRKLIHHNYEILPPPPATNSLLADLFKLLTSGSGSDLTVHCDGQDFKLHKTILSARSNVFSKMFQTDMIESNTGNVEIQDIEASVFQIFVEFVYTSKLDIESLTYAQLIGLVKTGDKYEVEELKQLCFYKLLGLMNEGNCGELAVLAYLYSGKTEDRNRIYDFISKNWTKLSKDAKFGKLVKVQPAAFLAPSVADADDE